MNEDERFMAAALTLARRVDTAAPNPRVGALVVVDGEVVGEGFHAGAGRPHAEREALRAAGPRASGATMYVTLEPCTVTGRTPPCAPAVVAAGIARVVVAMEDPDERVSGSGIAHLEDHGVEVELGVLEEEARRLNDAYVHHRSTGRPLVTLKLALSVDGRMAAPDGTSRWITSEETRRRVHLARSRAAAVLVGAGTVVNDDPELTAREVPVSRQPLRIVVDSRGAVSPHARIFSSAAGTLVATTDRTSHEVQTAWKEAGAEVVVLPLDDEGVDLDALVQELGRRELLDVLCEGGGRLATSLLRLDLVDRLEAHVAPVLIGDGGVALGDLRVSTMSDAPRWETLTVERSGPDAVLVLARQDR
ncbi:MAG TPA: bifunctional diaminohydroxyphosphoribosylaminopyrimidine deaminase/5-amino-6-(5-phosphoribosylamino)uracil reductase RibD [Actinomycetota bacterium]|nr:bifunctional diaminohydroxyphosphoribosylaminopyrimidine deaminase/5-amino-6-(5-phosphoribosylamino)uracil reductase RibD [Actinomycetota bacterium]